jgi:N-acetylated-alpha-linked acidic dipeptidase
VVYINSDSNSRGFLDAGGSHTLERLVTQVARDVPDPERNVAVLMRMRAHEAMRSTNMESKKEAHEHELIRLDALGSGSDYTPFLQHTGVAALNIGYGGEGGGGSYHSVYDSFDHYTRFGDPTFDYGVTQAKTTGRMVLRLANADVLPFELSTFAGTMSRYLDELTKLAEKTRQEVEDRNRLVHQRAYEIAADPTKPFVAPKAEPAGIFLNFAPLQNAVSRLKDRAREFDRAAAALPADATARQAAADQALMHIEQSLLRAGGLPRRPWFRHQIYAPGFYTGYGVKTVPGVREAIEQKEWSEANRQIEIAAGVINAYVAQTEKSIEALRGK